MSQTRVGPEDRNTPRWVMAFGIVALVLIVLFVTHTLSILIGTALVIILNPAMLTAYRQSRRCHEHDARRP